MYGWSGMGILRATRPTFAPDPLSGRFAVQGLVREGGIPDLEMRSGGMFEPNPPPVSETPPPVVTPPPAVTTTPAGQTIINSSGAQNAPGAQTPAVVSSPGFLSSIPTWGWVAIVGGGLYMMKGKR